MSERAVLTWMDHAWRIAVREGWASDWYYFHLVKVGLNCLLGKPDYWA